MSIQEIESPGRTTRWTNRSPASMAEMPRQLSRAVPTLSALPPIDLPTSRPRRVGTPSTPGSHLIHLDDLLVEQLKSLSRTCDVTLLDTLLAGYATLLLRLSAQQEIIVAVPTVEPTTVRIDLSADPPFRALVGRIATQAPAEESSAACHTIFDFGVDREMTTAGIEIWLSVQETANGLRATIGYERELFDPDLIEHFGNCFVTLLTSAATDADRPLSELPILSDADRQRMLITWNATEVEYPRDRGIHQLLAEQAARTPDAIALVFGDTKLTFREIDRRANQLARYLREQGVGRDDLVAVSATRSPELIIGLVAVLKSGAAYVPVDPKYPSDRVQFMIRDSGARLVLTTAACDAAIGAITQTTRFCMDRDWQELSHLSTDDLPSITAPMDLAYVIYTSGSTGQPKGVQIPHRAIVNFQCSMRTLPGLTDHDVLLSVTTFSFDIFGLEYMLPLLAGARLELASDDEIVDGQKLSKRIVDCGATMLQATPVTWRMLLSSNFVPPRKIKSLCGGEAMSPDLAKRLLAAGWELWNMYGPTETTVWSTVEQITDGDARISIGRPIANTTAYILDARLRPVPLGVVGQLYLGGDGLARGYLRRPVLTDEKFIHHPFLPGSSERIYNTGDVARYLPDGRIECAGRSDRQVKFRGYRIELEEIENILSTHEQVAVAAVTLREDRPGHQMLAGYYVPLTSEANPSGSQLRVWMKKKLPDHMIPAAFVSLNAMPMTPNGKIDRGKLPAPSAANMSSSSPQNDSAPPLNENEHFLLEIWKETLGRSEISATDNFFEIGGHSLLAAEMFVRLERFYRRPLPVAMLFSAPTLRELSEAIDNFPPISHGPHVVTFKSEGTDPPVFLMPSMAGTVMQWRDFVGMLESNRPICGVYMAGEPDYTQDITFEEFAIQCAQSIAQSYPGVRCHLCGYSFGGMLAFEVARHLKDVGCEALMVTILDTPSEPPIRGKMQMIRHALPIARNLLTRFMSTASEGQWGRELRALLFKSNLARRRLTVKFSNSDSQDNISFDYMFGQIDIPDRIRRLLSWSLKIERAYKPRQYLGDLQVIRAIKRPLLGPFDADLGWGKHVTGQVKVDNQPGGHPQMIENPQLLKIAELMKSSFRNFERGSVS